MVQETRKNMMLNVNNFGTFASITSDVVNK